MRILNGYLVLLIAAPLALVGCDAPQAQFSENLIFMKLQEEQNESFSTPQQQAIADSLQATFGTPDEPFFVPVEGLSDLLEVRHLGQAAGPVWTASPTAETAGRCASVA